MRADGFRWNRFDNHLPQASKEIQDAMFAVVSKAVQDIQGGAVNSAPVGETGLLKTSIQAIRPAEYSDVIAGGVGTNTEYGAYQELGTGSRGAGSAYPYPRSARYTMSWPGITARAFMANAAKAVEPAYVSAMQSIGSRLPRSV